jgi:hypothetical protein
MRTVAGLLCLLSVGASAAVPQAWYGTWVERSASPMTLVVEPAGDDAARFTYSMPPAFKTQVVMSFETAFDGRDVVVFVDGKPTSEVMTIKRIDDRHIVSAWKVGGKMAGTSRSELSADGKVVKVENDDAQPVGGAAAKTTQYWDKKSP